MIAEPVKKVRIIEFLSATYYIMHFNTFNVLVSSKVFFQKKSTAMRFVPGTTFHCQKLINKFEFPIKNYAGMKFNVKGYNGISMHILHIQCNYFTRLKSHR